MNTNFCKSWLYVTPHIIDEERIIIIIFKMYYWNSTRTSI